VKLAAVRNRSAEIQVRLGLSAPPLTSLCGGRVVIDVQRPDRRYVNFSEIREQLPEPDPLLGCSRVPIGVDLDGRVQFADFAEPEHAHLLVAGTTGSGKSEWLRAAIAGLIATNTPETLRLVLIDPKRNAFHALRGSAYLQRPIVYPDQQSVAGVLRELADLMDAGYRQMEGPTRSANTCCAPGGRFRGSCASATSTPTC
jgi:DNA segregation ATPase FtsK/SpoIIIE, S-DNA-T family